MVVLIIRLQKFLTVRNGTNDMNLQMELTPHYADRREVPNKRNILKSYSPQRKVKNDSQRGIKREGIPAPAEPVIRFLIREKSSKGSSI